MAIVRFLIGMMVLTFSVGGVRLDAAQISGQFPPENEMRAPDRVIEHAEKSARVMALVYSPDGRTAATAGKDGVIRIWDARTGEQGTGELLRTMEGHTGAIWSLAFRWDGKVIASLSEDRTVKRWDVETGKEIGSVPVNVTFPNAVLSYDRSPLMVEWAGQEVRLWNFETGDYTRGLVPQDGKVSCAAVQPDGSKIAIGTENGHIQMWYAESGGDAGSVLVGPAITSIAINGGVAIAGCADGTVRRWSESEKGLPDRLAAHAGAVQAIAISSKCDQFASASEGEPVKVWDYGTETLLCSLAERAGDVGGIVYNSNGQKMATVGADGNMSYWTVPLPPIPPADLDKIRVAVPEKARATPKQPRRLLVFWRADAILHKAGVPAANHAIQLLGKKTGAFQADFTRDDAAFTPEILSKYDAVVLNSTAHVNLTEQAKAALLDYVKRGGGIVGIHAAIDAFKDWPEGASILGATFGGHPWVPSGTWSVKVENPDHPLNRAWGGKNFKMHDEFYELAEPYSRADRQVLLSLDLSDPVTAEVKPLHRQDDDFAVAWVKRFGEGRVFYCMFGHLGTPFQERAVLEFYLDGIQYALGD